MSDVEYKQDLAFVAKQPVSNMEFLSLSTPANYLSIRQQISLLKPLASDF